MTEQINENAIMTVEDSELLNGNVSSLFRKYAFMACIGALGSCIAVILDGFFMGNGVGEMALAGISIVITFMYFMLALTNMYGIGASTVAGIMLGKGDTEEARKVYGATLAGQVIIAIVVAVIVMSFLEPILVFLGATSDVLPYAVHYSNYFWPLFPLVCIGMHSYFFCRLAEKPTAAMVAFVLAAVSAIIVEYVLVFKFHWDTAASALDCVIGIAGMVILVPYMQVSKNVFTLKLSDLKPVLSYNIQTIKIGFPMFVVNFCPLITTVVINRQLIAYGGNDLHIAAFGIFNAYVVYVMTAITNSLAQGLQPIASVNYGAKQFGRLRTLIKTSIGQSFVVMLALQVLVMVFATPIVGFFAGGAGELTDIAVHAMRIFILLYAFGNIATLVGGYYIGVEKMGLALLNSLTRVIIFAVPLLFIIPAIAGLDGVWYAQPVADVFACLVAMICIVKEYKSLGKN